MSDETTMQAATAVVTNYQTPSPDRALIDGVREQLGERPVHLALLFFSEHFVDRIEDIAHRLHESLAPGAMIGVSGEGVVHNDREYEQSPAIVLWTAHLPGANITSFHLAQDDIARFDEGRQLVEHLNVDPNRAADFLLLGDPFTFDVIRTLELLNEAYPECVALGGLASAGQSAGDNRLVFDGFTLRAGVCGVALSGAVRLDAVVSQGCRPIGQHYVITRSQKNVIFELGGRKPYEVVGEMLQACSVREREMMQQRGLLVGRVINEYQARFERGDFLVRQPLGFDADTGAMALNDLVRVGQTVQFHVRDADSASEDLSQLLANATCDDVIAALLFSCNGRGQRLFPDRHHDAHALAAACPGVPVAGFFAAGEIGPVQGANFLHGHTASIGLLRAAARDE